MKILILGDKYVDLPKLPDEFTQIVLALPAKDDIIRWALESVVPVSVVTADASAVSDELLEEVAEVVEVEDPEQYVVDAAATGDTVFMSWSDSRFAQLEALRNKQVLVLDMSDNFQELVLDEKDMETLARELTAKITADVLKTVRAEIQEMLRSRRFRPSSPKV